MTSFVVPFPNITSVAAPTPTFFTNAGLSAPFPTNSPWENFALTGGSSPENVLPYLLQVNANGFSFGYPSRTASASAIIQAFVIDLMLSALGGLSVPPTLFAYDKLSTTLGWPGKISSPVVFGSPYLTFIFTNQVPVFTTTHAIVKVTASKNGAKYRIQLNNGQVWVIYGSKPIELSSTLTGTAPFTGVIRVAIVPSSSAVAESALDSYSPVYPVSGQATLGALSLTYTWQTQSWNAALSSSDLLMITLPAHRMSLTSAATGQCSTAKPGVETVSAYSIMTLDGTGIGRLGATWHLKVSQPHIGWYSSKGVRSAQQRALLQAAVTQDIAGLSAITATDPYFFGKAVARAARLALIAEEVGLHSQAAAAASYLATWLTPWLDNTFAANGFVYDTAWGGLVSRNGAADAGADFGNGYYNDHHFHYGYFLYASAVLAKLNSAWGQTHRQAIYALVGDIFSLNSSVTHFTELRHFDAFRLHSWAAGLVNFADGRNQESSSEAVNAYYALSLVGMVFGDMKLAMNAATVTAFETQAAQYEWHNPASSHMYEPVYTQANRVTGIVWANKVDSGLWFAAAADRAIRLGIQVIPVTPVTESLFPDAGYAQEVVGWVEAAPGASSDAWNGFVWAVQAVYDNATALANVDALAAFDDGNSRSNLLWWVFTR